MNQPAASKNQQSRGLYSKVMLIDDNSLDNFVNKKLLETGQFADEIICYESPMEALAFIKKATLNELPEIIFLDIMMPGMDGFQFLDELTKLSATHQDAMKIIMLSTSDSFKDLNRANKSVLVKKFLNKPLTPQIVEAINV